MPYNKNSMKRKSLLHYFSLALISIIVVNVIHTTFAWAAGGSHDGGHSDPFALVMVELAAIVGLAMFGRWSAERFKQPAVLGELLIGVIIGNIGYALAQPFFVMIMHLDQVNALSQEMWSTGLAAQEAAAHIFHGTDLSNHGIGTKLLEIMVGPDGNNYRMLSVGLWMFSNLGVILLLFMVGLESTVDEMKKVGVRAFFIAILGVVVPFVLGLAVGYFFLPDAGMSVHLFLAATLCATSVGITARVFKDLDQTQTQEAKLILGAAVIDDVLALVLLAVVVGIATTGQIQVPEILRIILMSILFISLVFFIGERIARFGYLFVKRLDRHNNRLLYPLLMVFVIAWLANQIGLATIVGAFAAGLIINESHFKEKDDQMSMEHLISPLEKVFAPVFFVLMGMQVNLASFMEVKTLFLAFIFTVAAIIGKAVSGLPAGKDVNRMAIGIGMVPRGEVGLIFASIGKGLGVVSDSIFSAIVVMVILTTFMAPPLLTWSLKKK